MLNVLCIGDIHIKDTAILEIEVFQQKILQLVNQLLNESRLDLIVVLGDILDRHERGKISEITIATKLLQQLSEKVYTVLIIGNHDRENNSTFLTDKSFFCGCHRWNNFLLVDVAKEFKFKGYKFIACPYVYPGRFMEAINTIQDKDNFNNITAIFAHQEFLNAKMGAIVSTVGDKWESSWPLVISGHIHDYDRLQDNIIYTGTPRQVSFGETAKKTVSLFTFRSSKPWTEERFDLGMPRKQTLHLNVTEFTSNLDFLSFSPEAKGFLRLIIEGTQEELKIVNKHVNYKHLKSLGINIGLKPVLITDIKDNTETSVINIVDRNKFRDTLAKKLENYPDLIQLLTTLTNSNKPKLNITS